MIRFFANAIVLVLVIGALNAQRSKLYKDFDPLDKTDRFNLLSKQGGISYRLPNETRPIRYDIELRTWIDEANFTFEGQVKIHLRVEATTDHIVIHSKQLVITGVTLFDVNQIEVNTLPHELDPVTEFLTVKAAAGTWSTNTEFTLEVKYTGELRSDDQGFYRSSYVNSDNQDVWLATTQFEQTEARHGFPCYDEPGIRAVYGLTITHATRYHALANMPIKTKTEVTPGVTVTVFEDTPIMQSYLNAFVVSDFKFVSNKDTIMEGETLQSVYGVPSVIEAGEADFALEAGVKILKGLEAHLNYPYPLKKMDQIGIPDFYWGAMENWGLVTYRESSLYYNPSTSPMTQLDTVTGIIGHEYAHQWFGNIISPTWWEFIWLNEGFATLFEYISVDLVYPEFRMNDFMLTATCQPVFDRDAYETTRPMSFYVEDPESVQNLFDFVAYSKSGCVLRMLRHVLTPTTFTKGLTSYLNEMEYKSATPDDLYKNLNAAAQTDGTMPSDVTVKTIMDSWANQKGFPMITVRRDDQGVVTLTQERFLLERLPTSQAQTWWVPYNFVTKNSADFSNTAPDGWIPQTSTTHTVAPQGAQTWTNNDWIVFNKQATSYYRVNYDANLWALIIEELVNGDFNKIHLLNRAQLIDDAYAFARTKTIAYDVVFGLMEYLSKEMDYIPWVTSNRVLTQVDRVMASLDNYGHLQMFIGQAVQPIFEKLGVANKAEDTLFDRMARVIAVRWACYVGSAACQEATTERVKDYIATDRMFEADNRNTVLCAGLRGADETVFMDLWTKMTTITNEGTRNMLIDALACSQNEELLKTLLGTVLDNTVNYSVTERTRIVSAVANNGAIGAKRVTAFLEENLASIGGRVSSLASTINNIGNWISTQDYLDKFTAVLTQLQSRGTITAAQSTAAQTLARNNIQWVSDFGGSITTFLDDYRQRNSGAVQTISIVLLLATAILSALNLLR